jgi:hypothetical protein
MISVDRDTEMIKHSPTRERSTQCVTTRGTRGHTPHPSPASQRRCGRPRPHYPVRRYKDDAGDLRVKVGIEQKQRLKEWVVPKTMTQPTSNILRSIVLVLLAP